MVGHEMFAADLAVFAVGIFGLVEGGYVGFALGDPHAGRRPQAEGVDRRGRPALAVAAMTIARESRFARDLELDRAARTTGPIGGGNLLSSAPGPNKSLYSEYIRNASSRGSDEISLSTVNFRPCARTASRSRVRVPKGDIKVTTAGS
jgi:hypothetical protein